MPATPPGTPVAAPEDPYAAVRTRRYAGLLLMAAVLGVPVSAVAFGFLALVSELQWRSVPGLAGGLGVGVSPCGWGGPRVGLAG
ncbi:chloride channel protein, partial [Streptomyces anulatus]